MSDESRSSEELPYSSRSGSLVERLSLRTRMALAFGVLFAVILLSVSFIRTFGLPFTPDRGSSGDAQDLVLRQLSFIADLKKEVVLLWLQERRSDVRTLAYSEVVVSSVRKLRDVTRRNAGLGVSREALRADLLKDKTGQILTEALRTVTKSEGIYRKIQVADADEGLVIASTQEADLGDRVSGHEFFTAPLKVQDSASVVVTKSPATGRPYFVVSRAILDEAASDVPAPPRVLGVVIMYVDEDRFIKPLLYTGGGLGDTEDVILVTQDRRIITSLRHPLPDGTQAKILEYQNKAQPATLAAQGQEGVGSSLDYRGVSVLAAYRHVRVAANAGWGLVVKVDKDEILAPVKGRWLRASFISLLGVLAAAVMAALIAGRIARPIQDLILVARHVEAGNLDARAAVASADEVGNLASTFNSMIERVQNWHEDLEAQVKSRTLQLTELNEELTREVAERKRAEGKIRQQNDFLETVLESLDHPFYVTDAADYTIKMANSAAKLARVSDGLTCYSLTHGRNAPCGGRDHPCPLDEVRRTGQPAVVEHVHYDGNGNARNVEVHAYPIFDSERNVAQVIEYSLDITDRKRADKEREHLIQELEAKNAELERFTYTVSHDLKSPLITIKGFLGYLERDVASGNLRRLEADSARIRGAVERMGQLLEELLELSRIGRIVNPPQDVSLDTLVREARETLAGRIAETRVTVDVAEDLPVLYGDAARLREVVENLLDNAIKFMGDQPHPRVEIEVRRGSDETVVCFKDNGIGIDPRYHDKIFGLFERLEQQTEGTGIGLAIVKRIVKVHGGRIWVESEGLGRGSAFCFSLPEKTERVTKQG
ncbi:MAG: HAMP domain-containing protein [Desulfomonile tiedjei]|nr:HAMP domain-containing protein [Desulfomonile tiedjei]